jgi:hypothetical protein
VRTNSDNIHLRHTERMLTRTHIVLFVALGVTGACAVDPAAPAADAKRSTSALGAVVSEGSAMAPEQRLARAVALALSNAGTRQSVMEALRNSPLTEHKLVLQDFLAGPTGRAFAAAAERVAGLAPGEVTRIATGLPRLDLYVPSRYDRLSWRSSADLVVAADLDDDLSSSVAYDLAGNALVYQSAATMGRRPLLRLQREELKAVRLRPQAIGLGDVIQDAADGELSGRYVLRGSQSTLVVDLSDPLLGQKIAAFRRANSLNSVSTLCAPEDIQCGGGGGGGAPVDTTFLWRFRTLSVCDNNDCNQGNEFQFGAVFHPNGGSGTVSAALEIFGVPSAHDVVYARPLIFAEAKTQTDYIRVNVREYDTWPNADDNWDPDPFVQLRHNYRIVPVGDALFNHSDASQYGYVGTYYAW